MPVADAIRQRVHPLITSNRTLVYGFLSTLAVSIAIANALKNHSNFYSVAVYLSKSSRSLLVLANFGFMLALLSGRILQQIFFGPLLPAEVERLYDRIWFFVTESLLAFTIFRDDFDVPFAVMFGFLLFVKCFHWLLADRIEIMDQRPYPGPPTSFHIRVNALFIVLWAVDLVMFTVAVDSILTNGVDGTVLFVSEYAILMASELNSGAKYILSLIELRRARARGGESAPPWEDKSVYNFYIELTTDFLKLTTYLTFFAVVVANYGLPLNIVRDVYITARSFVDRLRAFQRYRSATRDMDARYPSATEEDLPTTSDRTCIICREEMVPVQNAQGPNDHADGPNMTPKKLPCGHIFHFQCLRAWLERQQSCPTCRRTVLENANTAQAGAGVAQNGARRPGQPNGANMPPQWNFGALNPGALNGQGQQGGQQGLLARLLGGPPQVPGQFAPLPAGAHPLPNNILPPHNVNGNIAPRQLLAARLAAPGQEPPPAFVFGYPWMLGGQNPGGLAQPPMLQGFYRPDGLWQPWPVQPAQRPPPGAPNTAQPADTIVPQTVPTAAQPAGTTVTPIPPPPSSEPPAPPTQDSTAAPDTSRTSGGPATDDQSSGASTPRNAAALAALRRLESSRSVTATGSTTSDSTTSSTPRPASAKQDEPTASPPPTATSASPQPAQSSATPIPTTSSVPTPTPTTSLPNPAPSSSAAPSQPRTDIPRVIPLFDFAQAGHAPHPMDPLAAFQTRRLATRRVPAFVGGHNFEREHQDARRALAQMPEPLTEEQLARLDRLTREAIDERLRVLNDVSATVWRCVEELTRMRSVLPAEERAQLFNGAGAGRPGESSSAVSSTSTSTSTAQTSPATRTSVDVQRPAEGASMEVPAAGKGKLREGGEASGEGAAPPPEDAGAAAVASVEDGAEASPPELTPRAPSLNASSPGSGDAPQVDEGS